MHSRKNYSLKIGFFIALRDLQSRSIILSLAATITAAKFVNIAKGNKIYLQDLPLPAGGLEVSQSRISRRAVKKLRD